MAGQGLHVSMQVEREAVCVVRRVCDVCVGLVFMAVMIPAWFDKNDSSGSIGVWEPCTIEMSAFTVYSCDWYEEALFSVQRILQATYRSVCGSRPVYRFSIKSQRSTHYLGMLSR